MSQPMREYNVISCFSFSQPVTIKTIIIMALFELRQYVLSLPEESKFKFALSYPFSWRGSYAEVCFSILEEESTREELLVKINDAYGTFQGWKGGDFTFDDNTDVNFEKSHGAYTDGGYTQEIISQIIQQPSFASQELRLVSLAFPK